MSNDKLIRGTIILTMATIVSKVLGLIYVVPFTAMVGVDGYILFEYAYKPYAIMISLSTMGIPLAVSKFVSKYNELGDYRMGRLMLKRGMILLTVTGVFWFFALYLSAPLIAESLVGKTDGTGNTVEDVIFVVKMVSFALIIVPPMALLRGFFQGYQSMEPTGLSQMFEQLARVAFVLIGGYLVLYVFHYDKTLAVGIATFGAFVGAVVGMWILVRYWNKQKKELDLLVESSPKTEEMKSWDMFKELFSYAIPFVFVGLAIPIYQAADTFMINKALMGINYSLADAEKMNSIISLIQKIILIPMSLATAFGLSLVPAITKSYTSDDKALMHQQITKTFQVVLYLTVPAIAGMMILSNEIYALMFGVKYVSLGGPLLVGYAPVAIVYSLYTVTAAMLQGMNKHKFAVMSLLVGLVVKIVINIPMIHMFESMGTVWSTNIGFAISILINLWMIKKEGDYSYRNIGIQTAYIFGLVLVMVVGIMLCKLFNPVIEHLFSSVYLRYLVEGAIGIGVGGFVYLFASLQTPIFREVFGQRFAFLDKMKIRK